MALKVVEPANKCSSLHSRPNTPKFFPKVEGVLSERHYLVCILYFLYPTCLCACIKPDMCTSNISLFAVAEIAVDDVIGRYVNVHQHPLSC